MPPKKKRNQVGPIGSRRTGTTRPKRKRMEAQHGPSQAAGNRVQQPSPSRQARPSQSHNVPGPSQSCNVPGPSQSHNVPGPSQSYNVPGPSQSYNVPGPSQSIPRLMLRSTQLASGQMLLLYTAVYTLLPTQIHFKGYLNTCTMSD